MTFASILQLIHTTTEQCTIASDSGHCQLHSLRCSAVADTTSVDDVIIDNCDDQYKQAEPAQTTPNPRPGEARG